MARGGYKPGCGQPRKHRDYRKVSIRLSRCRAKLRALEKRAEDRIVVFERAIVDCAQVKAHRQGLKDALAEVNKQIALHRAHALLVNHVPEPPKMPELPPITVPEAPFDWTPGVEPFHPPTTAREAAAALVPETLAHQALQPLANPPKTATIPKTYVEEAYDANMSPLDFMLKVMRDPEADPLRRDRMAMAAAPFIHLKAAEAKIGKREEAKRKAAEVGAGGSKFSAPAAPRLVVNGR